MRTHKGVVRGRYSPKAEPMHQTPIDHMPRPAAGSAVTFRPFFSVQERRVVGMEGALPVYGKAPSLTDTAEMLEAFRLVAGDERHLLLMLGLSATWLGRQAPAPAWLLRALEQADLPPARVILLLEGAAPEALPSLAAPVQRLKRLGFMLALAAPPGGEFPPLDALSLLGPHLVVLHQANPLAEPPQDPRHRLPRELVELLHGQGSLVLVKGIKDQGAALAALYAGADYLQGDFFAAALPHSGEFTAACAPGLEAAFSDLGLELMKCLAGERRRRQRRRRVMEHLLDQLSWVSPPEFERVLDELAGLDAELGCLYVLDRRGRQCTGLVFNPSLSPTPRREALCPLSRGADCSLHPFYLKARLGGGIHLSPPRPSLATGHPCLLAAARFRDRAGAIHVLCAEFYTSC